MVTQSMGGEVSVPFEIVGGFSQDQGLAEYDPNPDNFKDPSGATSDGHCTGNGGIYCPPGDAYPELNASSGKTRLTVLWPKKPLADHSVFPQNPWDKCRDLRGPGATVAGGLDAGSGWTVRKTAGACAKQFPKEYAAYKALYEAALVAVAP